MKSRSTLFLMLLSASLILVSCGPSRNPFVGPVPDGALMRFGRGDVSGFVIPPNEDVLIASSNLGIFFYRLNDLSLMSTSLADSPLMSITI